MPRKKKESFVRLSSSATTILARSLRPMRNCESRKGEKLRQ